jgi:hypothetical protein
MCRHPAIKASCGPDGPGKTAQARWYRANTDKPWEAWAIVAPTRLSTGRWAREVSRRSAGH